MTPQVEEIETIPVAAKSNPAKYTVSFLVPGVCEMKSVAGRPVIVEHKTFTAKELCPLFQRQHDDDEETEFFQVRRLLLAEGFKHTYGQWVMPGAIINVTRMPF